jgi:hypothetical protein
MSEGAYVGNKEPQRTTTWKFPQVIEDAVNHLGFAIESVDGVMEQMKKEAIIPKLSNLISVATTYFSLMTEKAKTEIAYNKEVLKKISDHQEVLESFEKRFHRIEGGKRSWRDNKNVPVAVNTMVVARPQPQKAEGEVVNTEGTSEKLEEVLKDGLRKLSELSD